jgi:glyoxylase-like metal-dependent hydrolase (beta-lactamase superfamily II)
VLVVALGAAVGAQAPAAKVTRMPVAGPVSVLIGPAGNVGVVADPAGVVLIDAMEAPLADEMRAAIAALPGGRHVRMVINTHWHSDHTGGNVAFAPDAVIVAHANVVPLVSRDVSLLGSVTRALPPAARPTKVYTDKLDIPVGRDTLRLVHYPHAHTDGDTVVFFDRLAVVHTGDLFFNGMFPFLDVDNGGDIRNWVKQLDTILAALPPDAKIIPGHGPLAHKADLQAFRQMLADSADVVQKEIDAGKTLDQIKAAGLPKAFDPWAKGFLTTAQWVELVYRSLKKPA